MTTTVQLGEAVRGAHGAYEAARGAPPTERAGWLEAVALALDAHGDELVQLAGEETHLPEGRLRTELLRTTFQLRLLAEEVRSGQVLDATIDHADPSWGMGPRPDIRRVNVPLGAVGVFGASNFPFAFSVLGGDTASALAAGCAVVHKVHEAHERLGRRTAEIAIAALTQASAPAGLLAIVTGRSAGESLVDHPLIKAVGFTGSTRVGRLLLERTVARPEPIPFYGELGSVNPAFVTERAWAERREEVLTGFAASFTLGMGQFCTKPGLLFVPELDAGARRTLEQAVAAAPRFPMLTEGLAEGYQHALEHVAGGAETVVPGEPGVAPAPTVLAVKAEEARRRPELLAEEMFGPASVVVAYGSEDNLAELAELLPGQLTATVHGQPGEAPDELVQVIEERAGRVIWNDWPTGVTVSHAQHHGGPFPATTAPGTTSVGTAAVQRFMRPVAYQSFPDAQLPPALQEANPWRIQRRVDGRWTEHDAGDRAGAAAERTQGPR
ncbi:aldehyde dehydrogenase (NADP(+)) [Georgenia soli]|uniref:aldehyde dehydrogenase (NADP(+)) n=1 Tax=Georgenia soli TaxID=638953 RepID=UPI000BFA6BFD|nr:aldehyde dehydrogenase family protein [Georgenia soli]